MCFLAGCALSYAVTAHHQREIEYLSTSGYLAEYFYQGQYALVPILEFAVSRTWDFLTWHVPRVVAIGALTAWGLLLLAGGLQHLGFRLGGNDGDTPTLVIRLLLFLPIYIGAAVLGLYPFGGSRHSLHLGPAVFLATGLAVHAMADNLSVLVRRPRLQLALLFGAAGVLVLAGTDAMRHNNPYRTKENAKAVLDILEARVQAQDLVYVSGSEVPTVQFYLPATPDNYHYGEHSCWTSLEECIPELFRIALSRSYSPRRIWVAHQKSNHTPVVAELEKHGSPVVVEPVVADGTVHLWLIANAPELLAKVNADRLHRYRSIVSGAPAARAVFAVYLGAGELHYVKASCRRADTAAPFFLHVIPADVADLPAERQEHGFNNLDFDFDDRHGILFDGKCLATVPLPGYPCPIVSIRTGQYIRGEGEIWEAAFPLSPDS